MFIYIIYIYHIYIYHIYIYISYKYTVSYIYYIYADITTSYQLMFKSAAKHQNCVASPKPCWYSSQLRAWVFFAAMGNAPLVLSNVGEQKKCAMKLSRIWLIRNPNVHSSWAMKSACFPITMPIMYDECWGLKNNHLEAMKVSGLSVQPIRNTEHSQHLFSFMCMYVYIYIYIYIYLSICATFTSTLRSPTKDLCLGLF